jgi:transcriptional regulator with XRE-family HTH domain
MDYLAVIARNLEAIRAAKGYTLDELAADARIARSHLANILNKKNSSVSTLLEVAGALGVGLEHLAQPELEVVSVPLKEAAGGVPEATPTKVYVVRDKKSRRRLRIKT